MNTDRKLLPAGLAALGFLLCAGTGAEQLEAEGEAVVLDRITVTAQKREETLQDVPFSIAAETGERLYQLGASNVEDIARNIAGLAVQNLGPGQSQVAMRGVSAGQVVRDQPGVKEQVGIYLDESVISLSLFTPDLDLFDLDRVEVLRGPQGTLFGSGSLSGTVRYITMQPQLNVSEAQLMLEGNIVEEDDLGGNVKTVLNVPLGNQAAFRGAFYYNRLGGFIDAHQPDGRVKDNVNSGERYGGRVALRFEPTDALAITPRLIYQKIEIDGFNRQDNYNILANPFTTTRPRVNIGKREQFTQLKEEFSDEFWLADLNIEYTFANNMSLTSISSYTDRDVLQIRDATALTGSITGGTIGLGEEIFTIDAPLIDATEVKMFTQEVRLASDPNHRLRWVTGAFYSDIERDYGQDLPVIGFEDMSGIPTEGPLAPKDVLFFSRIPYDFEQFALFGEGTLGLTDAFDLTLGLRYYDFTEKRVLNFDGIFADTTVAEPGKTSSSGWSPRLMASWVVADGVNLNAQVSKGFRLGGINDPLNEPLCSPQDLITFGGRPSFEDEELWNYEVGAKTIFAQGRGMFNVAFYYMDISDLQATMDAGTCSSRIIFNIPDARVRGVEAELSIRPIEQFGFDLSASYNDAELRSTITSVGDDGVEFVVEGLEKGARLPTAPRFEASASATYTWEMGRGLEGFVTGSFQHVGSRYTQIGDQRDGFGTIDLTVFPLGDPDTDVITFNPKLPSYNIGNLRAGIRGDAWELALFVNNLWDEHALLALDRERGLLARQGFLVNQPRTIGLTYRHFFSF